VWGLRESALAGGGANVNGFITHLACLEELERDRKAARRRASALPAVAGLVASSLWIAGCWFLEAVARERFGLP
jgi:hypothetical protein